MGGARYRRHTIREIRWTKGASRGSKLKTVRLASGITSCELGWVGWILISATVQSESAFILLAIER